jgi:hypothetical protein
MVCPHYDSHQMGMLQCWLVFFPQCLDEQSQISENTSDLNPAQQCLAL